MKCYQFVNFVNKDTTMNSVNLLYSKVLCFIFYGSFLNSEYIYICIKADVLTFKCFRIDKKSVLTHPQFM